MWEFLKGKKTYIAAFVAIVWSGLYAQSYIDQHLYEVGMGILVAVGGAGIRHGISTAM